ncbi:MAG: VOC family protein [Candidatus Bathyarchaeota archaeon]|nr:VOC family protein [Candidatus Termiticorpusculum sp.]
MDHTIVHFEIPAVDVEKLRQFYEQVFGWKIIEYPGPNDYWIIQTVPTDEKGMLQHPGVNGGMYKKPQPDIKPINYYSVESITDFLAKIENLGGKVISPKQEVPDVGWVAAATDPEGNQFALIEPFQKKV